MRRLKVAAMSLIAVAIVAAIMLIPQNVASATVYLDNSYSISNISSTIENESFLSNSTTNTAAYYTFTAASGYLDNLLVRPLICDWSIGDVEASVVWDYDGNAGTITATLFISQNDEYILYSVDVIGTIDSTNRFGCILYNSAGAIGLIININNTIDYIQVAGTFESSAIRYLTVSDWKAVKNISEYSSQSNYGFGYGLMSAITYYNLRAVGEVGTYNDGYADGLADGADNWDSFVGWDWLKAAISIVGTVLTIEIAPNIYLGYFVALPLILGAVMFVLQFKR